MAAVRTFWKGHLRLALVTIPIRLVSATSPEEKVTFNQVDRKTKQRIRYKKFAGEGGREVSSPDIVQGFEVEPGNYVLFERDELDALKLSTRHTVELTQFVDASSIEPLYFEKPYYILPDGEVAEEGYCVIRDALRKANKIGIGQIAMRGRENLVALKPLGDGLMLETLRYESEVRDADDVFSGIGVHKFRPGLIEMAEQLIKERSAEFDPGAYTDHYAEAVRDLVKTKLEGGEAVPVGGGEEAPTGGTVIDFMEALKRSVEKKPEKAETKPKTSHKRAAASSKRDPVKRSSAPEKAASRSRAKSKTRSATQKKKA